GADADHREAGTQRHIDQRAAGATRRALHEHALARLEGDAIVKEVVSDLIIGERCRLLHVGANRQGIDRTLRRRIVFRIAAAAMRPVARRDDDALARLYARHAGPDRLDEAAHLGARHAW